MASLTGTRAGNDQQRPGGSSLVFTDTVLDHEPLVAVERGEIVGRSIPRLDSVRPRVYFLQSYTTRVRGAGVLALNTLVCGFSPDTPSFKLAGRAPE